MFHVVTGGSGSGKSSYAEDEILRLEKTCKETRKKYYIATMEPFGEETKRKIERHRIMRAGKGFETVECYVGLSQAVETQIEQGSIVLLECMSNLTANEIYRPDGAGEQTVSEIMSGIQTLLERCSHLVVVTNEVFSESQADSEEMVIYKQILGAVNVQMASIADAVTEVVYGIPVEVKR